MSIWPKAGELFDNRYQIIEEVGQGGMAVVFKAIDQKLGQIVAIKLIHPHQSSKADAIDRFRKEAEAISRMQHPNVIKFHGFYFSQQRLPYMVLDYIAGGTLQEKLKAVPRLPLDEAVRIVEAIGKAIDHAHKQGIVHRDLKPANVMFNEHGQAILMDFGIAKIENSTALTMTGMALGSASYMSPEQARGEKLDSYTDLYTLGVILYEMLSGHLPFSETTFNATLVKVATQSAPDIRAFAPDVPEKVAQIVAKVMHPKREKRYVNAAAFVKDLHTFISTQQTQTFPAPVLSRENNRSKHQSESSPSVNSWLAHLIGLFPLGLVPIAFTLCIAGLAVVGIAISTATTTPEITISVRETVEPSTQVPEPTPDEGIPTESISASSIPLLTMTLSSLHSSDFEPTPTLIPTYTNTPTPRPTATPVPTQTAQSDFGSSGSQPPTATLTNRPTATMLTPTLAIATPVIQSTPESTKPKEVDK